MKQFPKRSPNVPQRKHLVPSTLDFPVVGIGASAGGLAAVRAFFEHMPSDTGMAFVVVLHLSPSHRSVADQIIQTTTRMPVIQLTETVHISKNAVYVIPPAHHLTMNDGYLAVTPATREGNSHIAIDLFFRDLADVHKERAFCLVLSGTGSDGAVGLSRIKEQGGVTFAQAPEDAEYDAMPRAAIETEMVDVVLPVVEMPQRLLEIWRNSQKITLPSVNDPELKTRTPESEQAAAQAERCLQDILSQLRIMTGHDFKHYKRATVLRRIERRMQVTAKPDLAAYFESLEGNATEAKALLADMLIGVTNFFRDREAFEALERNVIPGLFKHSQKDEKYPNEVRIWSAGCATGEEAYSLAMLASEQSALEASDAKLQVFATDIDDRAIAFGRRGTYPEAIVTDIAPARLRQHFSKEHMHYRVNSDIRSKVLFARHNFLSDPPFSHVDLIVCRNLLIYLDRAVQQQILRMFHFALRAGGYLFLGSSESLDNQELFEAVDKRNRIFRARPVAASCRRATPVPRADLARTPSAAHTVERRQPVKVSYADLHAKAIVHAAPPSLILDSHGNILHMNAEAGRFLVYTAGEMTRNLLSLAHPALRMDVRALLFQASQSAEPVMSRKIQLKREGKRYWVDLSMRPFNDTQSGERCILALFNEAQVGAGVDQEDDRDATLISTLEAEVQRTKAQLRHAIEHSDISGQELRASNEEMQAVNEELRAATEELETSKEELQSINEELLSVNCELKSNIDETDKINDYLSNLIASSDIATIFVDRGLRIRWFTPATKEIFSLLSVDTGRLLTDITHRLKYPQMDADVTEVFNSLNTLEREVTDGHRWYIARLLPYRSSEDHINGTVLTFIDITQRREAEEALRLSEERLRLAADSTHDFAIIILDDQGVIVDWNTGAELVFGYSKQEAVGAYYELIFTPQDCRDGMPEEELRLARMEGRAMDERWHQRKDGSQFFCSGEVTLLKSDILEGYVKIARDLTGHKRKQDEQKEKLIETQASNHLKDEFFAVMSHELKHPLNLIQLNAELLRRLPTIRSANQASRAVNTICEAVSSQARIIDDLLDVARVRTGKLKLKKQIVDFGQLLEDIVTVVDNGSHPCEVELHLMNPAGTRMMVDADPTRLEQVIWNLLNNAFKFTPAEGLVQVNVCCVDNRVQLDIVDSGVGLAAADLGKIFDLFSQAENHHAHHQREGLGIGLSLVRQLVEAQGGSVSASSQGIGHGCTFTVLLPLCRLETDAQSETQSPGESGRLSGLKVMLVDDSTDVMEVLKMLLELEDANVTAFGDPLKALEQARDTNYDVIISDIGMPVMDGHELIQRIRQLPHLKYTPAIALTGYGASSDQQKSRQSGFNFHVSKPVAHDDFIGIIEKLCSARLEDRHA